jgi:hypothetical protein
MALTEIKCDRVSSNTLPFPWSARQRKILRLLLYTVFRYLWLPATGTVVKIRIEASSRFDEVVLILF